MLYFNAVVLRFLYSKIPISFLRSVASWFLPKISQKLLKFLRNISIISSVIFCLEWIYLYQGYGELEVVGV